MQRLIELFLKYNNFLYFIFLQWIALYFIFNFNDFHKEVYGSYRIAVAGFFQEKNRAIRSYFLLVQENEKLLQENIQLKQQLIYTQQALNAARFRIPYSRNFNLLPDSLFPVSVFSFVPARLVQNSIHEPFNFFILNKGKQDGIEKEMGVISSDGVVGITIESSENYSIGISLLNKHFRLSTKIKSTNVHGTIHWRGHNPKIVNMEYIPLHIPVQIGDTVITSSYSNYFPEGYHIGKIIDVKDPKDGQGFHEILVLLSTDFFKLENVYIVKNKHQSELKKLNQIINQLK